MLGIKNPVTGVKIIKDKDGKVMKLVAEHLTGAKKFYSANSKDIPDAVLKLARSQLKNQKVRN